MNASVKVVGNSFAMDPIHHARHRLRADALARESLVFMLQLPEQQIAGFVYTWVSGQGKAGAAFCVYGPGIGPQPIFDFVDGVEVPDAMDFSDWRVGGARVCHQAGDAVARVTYQGAKASLEYEFTAMHPPCHYGGHEGGCPPWMADDRFEQSGSVRGILSLEGRSIPFESFGHRDHSWGTRDWGVAQHWKWLEAQAAPDLAVHVFDVQVEGRNLLFGYVLRDGVLAQVTRVDFSYEHDALMHHTAIHANVTDQAGRVTEVQGHTYALFEFKVNPLSQLNEGSMQLEIAGRPGNGHVEMHWPPAYLAYLQARAS